MREIKFRAWDKIEGKMWNPIVGHDGVLMASNQLGGYVSFPVNQDPLMQYTGLKDKNGKEIYEGDIVKPEYHDMPCEVKFGRCWFYLDGDFDVKSDDLLGNYTDNNIEVIGNIVENPELLEK